MSKGSRWNPAVRHRDAHARDFITDHFGDTTRRVLLVAGAGFDPRSTHVAQVLAAAAADRTTAMLIREQRPSPARALVDAADANTALMSGLFTNTSTVPIEVFALDGAVTGGRAAVRALAELAPANFTDVLVDVSALSIGVFFPLVRFLDELVRSGGHRTNLHLTITVNPEVERSIEANYSDAVVAPHGYQGRLELDSNTEAIRLWMPHIALGKRAVLERIFRRVDPHDVCPILPFPAADPRRPEELMDHYSAELENSWEVHARNVIYADESNPLDVYRTVLRIDRTRRRIFQEVGGSQLVLSPVGAKPLAVGTMLAAIEQDFPVRYVEAVEFVPRDGLLSIDRSQSSRLHHLWLAGEAYAAQVVAPSVGRGGPEASPRIEPAAAERR
ncbi:MAG: hypothetical protein IT435_00030 [Phycisphaerales bacterium]|nr:hypothetical protein [Phycisphaerales bacterium]